jgi:hypothetical protein
VFEMHWNTWTTQIGTDIGEGKKQARRVVYIYEGPERRVGRKKGIT